MSALGCGSGGRLLNYYVYIFLVYGINKVSVKRHLNLTRFTEAERNITLKSGVGSCLLFCQAYILNGGVLVTANYGFHCCYWPVSNLALTAPSRNSAMKDENNKRCFAKFCKATALPATSHIVCICSCDFSSLVLSVKADKTSFVVTVFIMAPVG